MSTPPHNANHKQDDLAPDAPSGLTVAAPVLVALFAALVATDPFNIRGRNHWASALNEAALVFWVVTIVLVIWAGVLKEDEGKRARRYRHVAIGCGAIAAVLTVIMFVAIPAGWADDKDHFEVTLTPASRAALDELCQTTQKHITGVMKTGPLEGQFVVLTLDKNLQVPIDSHGDVRCDSVRIPVDSILALREIHSNTTPH